MKYRVHYFFVDRGDRNCERDIVLDVNSKSDIITKLKKMHRGCHIHSVRAEEIVEDEVFTPSKRERCEYCNTPLNDGGTCPVCDDGEEDYGGNLTEGKKDEVSVEEFWEMVCCGEDKQVFEICRKDRNPKGFYHRFGSDHSYIMGAIRNGNWSTARILMTFGVEFTPQDARELALMLMQAKGE